MELVNALATDKDRAKEKARTLLMLTTMGFATPTKPAQKNNYFLKMCR
jgi:hypothetical protein